MIKNVGLIFHKMFRNLLSQEFFKFDTLNFFRIDKLTLLGRVLGIYEVQNPDPTYELTPDNMKKIFAIHMRFRYIYSYIIPISS